MTAFKLPITRHGTFRAATARTLLLAAAAIALTACQHNEELTGIAGTVPDDYRQRHPIAIKEGERTVELFIGRARGGLTPAQRDDVGAFATAWRAEASGGIVIDVPARTDNARAARDALAEVRSILQASGAPASAIAVRFYSPPDPRMLATLRLKYPKMIASAGPCGLWPHDLGPSLDRVYNENVEYWNLGCAHQHNLAAMVENPADLVQPRGDYPPYAGRRSVVLDKYRKGEDTAAVNPEVAKAKISEIGQ